MPIVPSERTGISTSVPGVNINPSQYGAQSEAIAKFGSTLANTGLGIYDQIKQEEAKTAANQAYGDDLLEVESYTKELSIRSSGGYITDENGNIKRNGKGEYKTMSEEFKEWSDKRFQDKQLTLPSKLAQDLYIQKASPIYQEKAISVQNSQLESSIKNSNDSIDYMATKAGNAMASTPDLRTAYGVVDHVTASITEGTGKLRNVDASNAMALKYERSISDDLFRGAKSRTVSMQALKSGDSKREADSWMNILLEQDGDSLRRKQAGLKTIAAMLDPDKRASYIADFANLQKISTDVNLASLDARVKATAIRILNAKPGEKINGASLIAEVQAVPSDRWDQFQKGERLSILFAADQKREFVIGGNAFRSESEILSRVEEGARRAKAKSEAYSDPKERANAGLIETTEVKEKILAQVKIDMSKRRDDFAKYAEEQDEEIGQAWNLDWNKPGAFLASAGRIDAAIDKSRGRVHYGSAFGNDTTYWRPVSKENSARLGNMILNSKDTAQTAKMIYGARNMRNFPDLMDRVIQDKNLPPQYRIVGLQPDLISIQDTLALLGDQGKSVNELFNDKFIKNGSLAYSDFAAAADPSLGAFVQQSLVKSGMNKIPKEDVVAISGLIETKAKDLMLKGYTTQPKQAWKAATESLLGRHVHMIPVGNSFLTINKYADGQEITQPQVEAIGSYVESISTVEGLSKLGIDIPKNKAGQVTVPEKAFLSQIAKTGQYVQSPIRDQDGDLVIQVTYKDMLRNTTQYVLRGGKPLTIKQRDAEQQGFKIKKEQSKSWFHNFEFIGE